MFLYLIQATAKLPINIHHLKTQQKKNRKLIFVCWSKNEFCSFRVFFGWTRRSRLSIEMNLEKIFFAVLLLSWWFCVNVLGQQLLFKFYLIKTYCNNMQSGEKIKFTKKVAFSFERKTFTITRYFPVIPN